MFGVIFTSVGTLFSEIGDLLGKRSAGKGGLKLQFLFPFVSKCKFEIGSNKFYKAS